MANFNLNDYVMVNERIEKFYEKYPDGSIQTEITKLDDGLVVIKAYAYRDKEDRLPCTGHAYEREGAGYVNKTSFIENCETSAIGRALAIMGFEIKKGIASREEMEKVERGEQKITDEQVDILNDLIKSTKTDTKKFLDYFKVKDIYELPVSKYGKAFKLLNSKDKE